MNKDKLKAMRTEYKILLDQNDILNNIKIVLENMEQDEKIKKYIKLKEILSNNQIMSIDDIIKKIFDERVVDGLGKIYVYAGSYKYDKRFGVIKNIINLDENSADYFLYRDLVNSDGRIKVRTYNCNNFESKNIVIRFREQSLIDSKYLELRKIYCLSLLEGYSEEEILQFFDINKEKFGIESISRITRGRVKVRSL